MGVRLCSDRIEDRHVQVQLKVLAAEMAKRQAALEKVGLTGLPCPGTTSVNP